MRHFIAPSRRHPIVITKLAPGSALWTLGFTMALFVGGCAKPSESPPKSSPPVSASPTPQTGVTVGTAHASDAEKLSLDRETESLLTGHFPEDPAVDLIMSRCSICHSVDYLNQQRLTPGQWAGTVKKMQGFGAPVTDDEGQRIASYLAKHFQPRLATKQYPRVDKPNDPPVKTE